VDSAKQIEVGCGMSAPANRENALQMAKMATMGNKDDGFVEIVCEILLF
jgi:hypothetical protein